MRLIRLVVPAALVATAIGFASITGGATDLGSRTEVQRIRTHFDSVLTALGARDDRSLSPERAARRNALLATLTTYRDRGVFPHNYDFPGQLVPYFVDRRTGTLCAVAYLLESTGRRDIVDRVAAANNNVRVPALASDTALVSWLDANGITLDEAAFIQVPYMQPVSKAEVARQASFAALAPFAVGSALITSAMNLTGNADGHRTTVSKLGVVAGVTTALMGSAVMAKTDLAAVGASAIAIGITSLGSSLGAMHQHSVVLAAQKKAEAERSAMQTSIAPIISAEKGGSAGLAVSLHF